MSDSKKILIPFSIEEIEQLIPVLDYDLDKSEGKSRKLMESVLKKLVTTFDSNS
jgi:hypothetical protein